MKVRVASAGTGKTTSLVRRYLELIGCGVPLRRIAGVTFTRACADELRQRVGEGVHELLRTGRYLDLLLREPLRPQYEEALRELDGATLTTIHGFMIDALRLLAPFMGLDPDFSILGEWEAEALFEEEVNSLLFLARDAQHGLHQAAGLLGTDAEELLLALFRQRSLSEQYTTSPEPKSNALLKLFEASYKRYEVRLGATLLPPSEVERRALRLVRTPQALTRLAQRYRVVLVDEYQDVNPLQGRFFESLEGGGMAVEVVGDPKQSIYGFRNADVEVFRRALTLGDTLEPLTETRRHAQVISRFLNHMTGTFALNGMGFGPMEAPDVTPAGDQASKKGRVELHWITGDEPIGKLRDHEAHTLARRLKLLHDQGYDYNQMAVLARSYAGLEQVEAALRAQGLPYVLLQGRGYFERIEIRDLYHALRVGIEPSGVSLLAWLRSPFGALPLDAVDAVLSSGTPLEKLRADHPHVHERLELLREHVRGTPLEALKFLIREPFLGGKRYVDFLETRARENVDALLFTVAQQPPGEIEILLDRLDLLSRQADAGDVPQSGEGIELLTVHRAKGLEWPVVGVFDLGRMNYHPPQPLYVDPDDGRISLRDTEGFDLLRDKVRQRGDQESYRLLYVAASRARDVLVMSGSVKSGRADGWAKALEIMGLGASEKPWSKPEFVLQSWPYEPTQEVRVAAPPRDELKAAPWLERTFRHHPFPPVHSPSRLKGEEHEPLPLSDPNEGEILPGQARTVGTLVHYAISQNWSANNEAHLENLRAQEVMFPFSPQEQQEILQEVRELLANYERLLGNGIPPLEGRRVDQPELPMALPQGPTVWQGIIDRLYCIGGVWYLEDYKTDREVHPEKYHFQLAVYLKAIQQVRGITPKVQLVFLRFNEVVVIPPAVLEDAFDEATAFHS